MIGELVPFQRSKNFAHRPIEFLHVVAVYAGLTRPLPGGGWRVRIVHGLRRIIEKERTILVLLDKLNRLAGELRLQRVFVARPAPLGLFALAFDRNLFSRLQAQNLLVLD